MPITVICDECSESHRVRDDSVGKQFKCKGCGKRLTINAPAPQADDFADFDESEFADEEAKEYSRKKAPRRAKSGTSSRKSSASSSGKPKSVPIRRTDRTGIF